MESTQEQLQFLLRNGWKLVGGNTVESPKGDVVTKNIERAARVWQAKLKIRKILDRTESNKFLRSHLTKETFWSRLTT